MKKIFFILLANFVFADEKIKSDDILTILSVEKIAWGVFFFIFDICFYQDFYKNINIFCRKKHKI